MTSSATPTTTSVATGNQPKSPAPGIHDSRPEPIVSTMPAAPWIVWLWAR